VVGRDRFGIAGRTYRLRSRRESAEAHRPPDRRHGRNGDYVVADRFLDDRVDGLAPPRRDRACTGLVPLAADRCGARLNGFVLPRPETYPQWQNGRPIIGTR
jgi:hypothetical protein